MKVSEFIKHLEPFVSRGDPELEIGIEDFKIPIGGLAIENTSSVLVVSSFAMASMLDGLRELGTGVGLLGEDQ